MTTTQVNASTVTEFCDRYNIHRATYYRNARQGKMPAAIKVGSATRILASDEEAWLAQQRITAPVETQTADQS